MAVFFEPKYPLPAPLARPNLALGIADAHWTLRTVVDMTSISPSAPQRDTLAILIGVLPSN